MSRNTITMKVNYQLNESVVWVSENNTTLELFEGGFSSYVNEELQYTSTNCPLLKYEGIEELINQSPTIRELENFLLTSIAGKN